MFHKSSVTNFCLFLRKSLLNGLFISTLINSRLLSHLSLVARLLLTLTNPYLCLKSICPTLRRPLRIVSYDRVSFLGSVMIYLYSSWHEIYAAKFNNTNLYRDTGQQCLIIVSMSVRTMFLCTDGAYKYMNQKFRNSRSHLYSEL